MMLKKDKNLRKNGKCFFGNDHFLGGIVVRFVCFVDCVESIAQALFSVAVFFKFKDCGSRWNEVGVIPNSFLNEREK